MTLVMNILAATVLTVLIWLALRSGRDDSSEEDRR